MRLNTLTKFLLIAHHPAKGRFLISETQIKFGIIGAALLELSLTEQIKIEDNKLLLIKDKKSDDPVITEIVKEIRNSEKARKVRYWVTKLARRSRMYKWSILSDLERGKLIRIEHRKFLGLIPYRKSYLIGSSTRSSLIYQLKNSVLFSRDSESDNVPMLGLVKACKMHKILASDRDELKKLKKELKEIMKESPIADTVDKTVKQVQAAIIASVIASTAAATASASS
jgi:Golgi phosphoprotein 3